MGWKQKEELGSKKAYLEKISEDMHHPNAVGDGVGTS